MKVILKLAKIIFLFIVLVLLLVLTIIDYPIYKLTGKEYTIHIKHFTDKVILELNKRIDEKSITDSDIYKDLLTKI